MFLFYSYYITEKNHGIVLLIPKFNSFLGFFSFVFSMILILSLKNYIKYNVCIKQIYTFAVHYKTNTVYQQKYRTI